MDTSILFRHILRMPPPHRTALLASSTPTRALSLLHPGLSPQTRSLTIPRIIQPSFWSSLIPKPLKSRSDAPRRKDWNPATPYIILGLLVGSQAIQILWLKQDRMHNMRRAEAKMGVLREVIERVQRGEEVAVEGVLGTGVEGEEREWAEVLDEIKNEEALFQSKKKRKAAREAAEKEAASKMQEEQKMAKSEGAKQEVESVGGVKFY